MSDVRPVKLVRTQNAIATSFWPEPRRGVVEWQTLFSSEVTGTTGLTSGVARIPPGGRLAPHRHDAVETYFVLTGKGLLMLGDDECEVEARSSVLIPPGLVHGVRNLGSSDLEFFYAFAVDSFDEVVYEFPDDSGRPAGGDRSWSES